MKRQHHLITCIVFLSVLPAVCACQQAPGSGPSSTSSSSSAAYPALDFSFYKGADVSFIKELEDKGCVFYDGPVSNDLFSILRRHGLNYIRIRIWNNPSSGYCDKANTLLAAQRIKALGMRFLLDFHYSDDWADPGKQYKPAAWTNLDFTGLTNAVYAYTKDIIGSLKAQGTLPDMVQIGNEITSGLLWDDGKVSGFSNKYSTMYIRGTMNGWGSTAMTMVSNNLWEITYSNLTGANGTNKFQFDAWGDWSLSFGDSNSDGICESNTGSPGDIAMPTNWARLAVQFNDSTRRYSFLSNSRDADNWDRLSAVLKAGVSGVKDAIMVSDAVQIMVHLDRGADYWACTNFFDRILARGVNFDVIGLSYYSWWHGTNLGDVSANLGGLVSRYGKYVAIAETAYPWTLTNYDAMNNQVWTNSQLFADYPATVAGQKGYLAALIALVRNAPSQRGIGVFYWAPENVSIPSKLSDYENLTLFDNGHYVLDSINAFSN